MRFTKYGSYVAAFIMGCGVCLGQGYSSVSLARAPHWIPPKNASMMPAGQANATNNGIQYWGGPVMNKPTGVNVYYIWYGNWSGDNSKQILNDFIQRLGGSPYFNINTTYYDFDKGGEQDPVYNKVNLEASVDDHYSMGSSLSDFDVAQVVANHTGTDLPIDENGVYFLITSPDVSQQESAGIGGPACAWHNNATVVYSQYPGRLFDIKVSWIGNPHQYFPLCGVQDPSPNSNPDADSMASFVAHELEESVTDPDGNAWINPGIIENADLCIWTFGNYQPLPGNPVCNQGIPGGGCGFNMRLGNRRYMIQQNWVNAKGGYCALKWDQ